MKTLAILGASGHGKVVADAALQTGAWQRVVFYDDAWPDKKHNGASEVVGNTATLLHLTDKPDVIVAIGKNTTRINKQRELTKAGFSIATVVHPKAIISAETKLGQGSVVMAGAVINVDVSIGEACIINTNSVVEHDCILADGVHISPGVCLAGGVSVGFTSWVGIGAAVIQLVAIGKNVMVGAGAAVVADVADNQVVVGIPARPLDK